MRLEKEGRRVAMNYIIVTFTAEREGDYYVSKCRELGTASFGASEDEAVANLSDATSLYLNTLAELGESDQVLREKGIPVHRVGEPARQRVLCPPNSSVHSQVIPLVASL